VGPESRYEFRDTYTMNLAKHTIKLGGNYSYNKYFEENTGDVLGSWTFGTAQYFDPDDAASLANLTDPVLFSASLPPINTKKPTQYVAFFVQDDWQLRENLVLNLGLRWERLINCCNEELDPSIFPVEVPLIDVSERGDKNNFGPRLGLVWDIEGEGTSVLRWGYGVYYGHVRTLGVLDEFRNFQQYSLEITNQIMHAPAPRASASAPGIPDALDALIAACLEKERARRPQTADALIDALDRLSSRLAWTHADADEWWSDYRERKAAAETA
jgi:hypothetical protein